MRPKLLVSVNETLGRDMEKVQGAAPYISINFRGRGASMREVKPQGGRADHVHEVATAIASLAYLANDSNNLTPALREIARTAFEMGRSYERRHPSSGKL